MRPITIIVDYKAIKTMLRALDSHVALVPDDADAQRLRSLIIETEAVIEVEAMVDTLLEDNSSEEHKCSECEHNDNCHPSGNKVN